MSRRKCHGAALAACFASWLLAVLIGTARAATDAGLCAPDAAAYAACDDGDPCTNSYCLGGKCVGSPKCDDSNACTVDSCDPGTGACTSSPAPDGTPCDKGTFCSWDKCTGGACQAESWIDCNDNNPCTTDSSCEPYYGCEPSAYTELPEGTPCDDGNACTKTDVCHAGAVCGGAPVNCDDGDPCTVDTCKPATGCSHEPTDAGTCDLDGGGGAAGAADASAGGVGGVGAGGGAGGGSGTFGSAAGGGFGGNPAATSQSDAGCSCQAADPAPPIRWVFAICLALSLAVLRNRCRGSTRAMA